MQNYITTKMVFQIVEELDLDTLLSASDHEIEFLNTYFPPVIGGKEGTMIRVGSGILVSHGDQMTLLGAMPELKFPSIDDFMIELGSENRLRETSMEVGRV